MTATALIKVKSHVSDNRAYVDEQIKDLDIALDKAEAAVHKLRETKSSSKRRRYQVLKVLCWAPEA